MSAPSQQNESKPKAKLPAGRRVLNRAAGLAEPLPSLLLEAQRIAETVRQGLHGRRRPGAGETFWQFRDYQQHDGTQRIDWRQSAKGERLYVRDAEWEAAQTAYLWTDRSASMVFRSSKNLPTKRMRGMVLLLATSTLLVRHDERVALMSRFDRTKPAAGRGGLINLANALIPAEGEDEPDRNDDNPYGNLPPAHPLPRHAQTVWFGDFQAPLEDIQSAIAPLVNSGVKGHLVQIFDPAEEQLPYRGRTRFKDLESGDRLIVPRVETIRDIYHERLEAHRAGLNALARNAGWGLTLHRTDQSAQSCLMSLYTALAEGGTLPGEVAR
ncbi:MAG: DUF58 domain-containing protein [Alphaproteobacteria bacterium]|nr:DUF58 domain-containing protein [Alphaproteobacteria bacterium SS10]